MPIRGNYRQELPSYPSSPLQLCTTTQLTQKKYYGSLFSFFFFNFFIVCNKFVCHTILRRLAQHTKKKQLHIIIGSSILTEVSIYN